MRLVEKGKTGKECNKANFFLFVWKINKVME